LWGIVNSRLRAKPSFTLRLGINIYFIEVINFPKYESKNIYKLLASYYHVDDKECIDSLMQYLLRSVVPPEYCFYGVQSTIYRIETAEEIKFSCTFWYLSDGSADTAGLYLVATVVDNRIEYSISIQSVTKSYSESKLWKEIYLFTHGYREHFSWEYKSRGVLD